MYLSLNVAKKNKGLILKPERSRGLECFADAY